MMNGEELNQLLKMADRSAVKFYRLAVGKFNPATIKADMQKLQRQGFNFGKKSQEEIDRDVAAIPEHLQRANGYQKNWFKTTAKEKRALVAKIDDMVSKGYSREEACALCRVSSHTYSDYKKNLENLKLGRADAVSMTKKIALVKHVEELRKKMTREKALEIVGLPVGSYTVFRKQVQEHQAKKKSANAEYCKKRNNKKLKELS